MSIPKVIANIVKTIVWQISPPDSRPGLFLKGIRDQFRSHRYTIDGKIKQAAGSYPKWVHIQEQKISAEEWQGLKIKPCVSFLLPPTQNDDDLQRLIGSLQKQIYPHWQLVIFAGKDQADRLLALDDRIRCVSSGYADYLSLAENATGDFVVCARPGDTFSSRFLVSCVAKLNAFPDAQIIYTDHDQVAQDGSCKNPFFKPDSWSPEMLLSVNYLSRALLDRNLILSETLKVSSTYHIHIGQGDPASQGASQSRKPPAPAVWGLGSGTRVETDPDVQEWEIVLNGSLSARSIVHVADVLVHQDSFNVPIEMGAALERYLKRLGRSQPAAFKSADGWRVTWADSQPLVSIIIPNKNSFPILKRCLDSILAVTSYPNYELIIVDNQSTDENILTFYREFSKKDNVKIVDYAGAFNFSRANNLGAAAAQGELLLFLNNDIEVLDQNWLGELAIWALRPEVGVVGAKLLFPDGRIQHAGIVLGLQGFTDHLYLNTPENYCGLIGSVNWYRNVSAVTGACQMMRRAVFKELGGYNQDFKLIFSDVEICMKASQHHYRIVYTPFTKLIHYQGTSRGRNDPATDIVSGFKYLLAQFDGDDPFFSPNLTYTYIPGCQPKGENAKDRIAAMREKLAFLERWVEK